MVQVVLCAPLGVEALGAAEEARLRVDTVQPSSDPTLQLTHRDFATLFAVCEHNIPDFGGICEIKSGQGGLYGIFSINLGYTMCFASSLRRHRRR